MNVVSHAPDLDRLHLILPGDAAHEGPKPFAQFGRDHRPALFGAEDAMDLGADVRHATHSAVPSGLMQFQISVPNVETLGYYRLSLRDDELQMAVTLGKNVRAPTALGSSLRKISDAHRRPQPVRRFDLDGTTGEV